MPWPSPLGSICVLELLSGCVGGTNGITVLHVRADFSQQQCMFFPPQTKVRRTQESVVKI